MPFIWNDEDMLYLDDSVDFDRSKFSTVRKLFIKFKDHEAVRKIISENWIKEKFEKFGVIQQIELVSNEGRIWSHITFSNDKEAHIAFKDASAFIEIDEILPADTWCQPEPMKPLEPNDIEVMEAMNRLEIANKGGNRNDVSDLLIPLIALSLDSNSLTQPIKESMENRIIPSAKTFTLNLRNANYSLGEVRSILASVGPYVSDFAIRFMPERWPKNMERYFFKMCQHLGHLRTLRLEWVPPDESWLQQLKPLLNRIECLQVMICNYDFDYDIDFQSYCPNLKTLKIRMNLKGELLTKPWPKLEKISIRDNQYMEEKLVLQFMKNNPQLTYLKIAANDCNNLLKQISVHLANLEKLCLYQAYPNICADNLLHLIDMKDLKRLKLMYLEDDDFNEIVNCLRKFKQLQELKLHIFYDGMDRVDIDELHQPIPESIICLAEELCQLECFHIRYCEIDAATLQSFIRSAKKLKRIAVYRCGLEITDGILESIETIRKTVNSTNLLLYADKMSSELNDKKTYRYVTLVKL